MYRLILKKYLKEKISKFNFNKDKDISMLIANSTFIMLNWILNGVKGIIYP